MFNKILNNKKLLVTIAVVLVALIGVGIWLIIYRPFDDSLKNITVEVVNVKGEVVLSQAYRTNASSLEEFINFKEKDTFQPVIVGGFVNEIFGIKPDSAKHEFVSLLASDARFVDTAEYAVTKKAKNGASCTTTNVGVNAISLKDGETYMFVVLTW